jgi:glutamate/tyrosine decarboxylase-like PLP-dependent enzyme
MSSLHKLPRAGASYEEVTRQVDELVDGMTSEQSGKLSSTAFWGIDDALQIAKETHAKFFSWNALFTFQEGSAAKLENDVLDICVDLVGGDEQSRGNLTSGGTESNFCALHAMRNWAREYRPDITAPEIVAPYSIHSTVHKTAKVLDIKVVTVPQLADLSADVAGMQAGYWPQHYRYRHIGPQLALLDVLTPSKRSGQIAIENDLWLHVDACVGAYIAPFLRELGEEIPAFDLSVPGVRSISGDLHKYGYAPKPLSTIIWKSQAEQAYHYIPVTEWPCGLYLSQGFVGSRPLAPIAAVWALMHHLGHEGYIANAKKLLDIRNAIIDKVASIDGLTTWPTHGPLLQIAGEELDIQLVVGAMEQHGWRLLGVLEPPAIHLTIDVLSESSLEKFLADLETSVANIRAGKIETKGLLTYGGVAAEETAPKWLLSAVEIMGVDH